MRNQGGGTLSLAPNDFALGDMDSGFQYDSPETSLRHNASIQRVVYHEIKHQQLHHFEEHAGDEDERGLSLIEEAEVISDTNAFMKKYYNEPERDLNHLSGSLISGTSEWDFNPSFVKEGYNQPYKYTDTLNYKENMIVDPDEQHAIDINATIQVDVAPISEAFKQSSMPDQIGNDPEIEKTPAPNNNPSPV